MFQNFFKFIPIAFLLFVFLVPQNAFAQSNAEQIIKRYESGEITIPTSEEKQIISEYLESTQPSNSISLIRNYSPDAVIYSEDFTGQVLPTGWTNVDNGITGEVWQFNNPGTRTITGNFDADFAILDSDNYGSGTSQNATLTTVAINASAATTVLFGFDLSYRHLSSSLTVDISVDNVSWTNLETITVSTGYPNPPVYKEYDVTATAAGQSTVYFRWTYVGSFAWWGAIDNVVVYEPDPTPNPAALVSPANGGTNVSINATLNWLAGGGTAPTGYRINFGTDNPPTNIENNTDLGLVTSYTPGSPLTYSTTYYWEIIPYNGAGSATGTTVWSFTTEDDPVISAFPYLEDFNGGTFPPLNWTRFTGILADPTVLITGSEWFEDDYLNNTGNTKSARTNIFGTTRDGWLMTPPIDLGTGTNYQLEFDLALTDFGNSNPPDNESGVDDKFAVVISTDGGTTWTSTNTLKLWDYTGANYYYDISHTGQHEIIDLTGYTGVIMLGFYGESTISNADNDLFVDNVEIKEVPTVPLILVTPTSKDFGDVLVGTSSADQTFTITNVGSGTLTITSGNISIVGTDASQFVLSDGNTYPINLTTGQSATVDVNFSPTSIGAKTADLQIVDNTADGTTTVPLTGIGFAAVSAFSENFDAVTPPALPQYWVKVGTSGSANTQTTNPFSAPNCLYIFGSGTSLPVVSMPPVDNAGAGTHRLSFKARANFTVGGVIEVGYLTDPNDANTFVSVGSQTISSLIYADYFVDPGTAPGSNQFLAFRHTGSPANSVLIDDVAWALAPAGVPDPAVLVSPPDAGTDVSIATLLEWASGGGGAATGYLINFGTDNPPTNIENNTDLGLVTSYTPSSALNYSTTYYWEIIPYNGSGNATGTTIWSFTTTTPQTLPFSENFDAGTTLPPGWGGNMLVLTNHGTSGTNGLTRNLYSGVPAANANSPVIGPKTATTQLEFDYRIVNWSGYPSTPTTLGTGDEFDIQISTDGGATFTTIYTIDQFNHVTSLSFAKVTLPLGAYASSYVIVKWDLTWGTGDYYFDIDNVFLREPPVAPAFEIAPTSHDYGNLFVGNTLSQDFVITNTGAGTLTVNSGGITITGTDAGQFILGTVTYPISLGIGESDTIDVSFTPTSQGGKTADLELVHNATGSPAIVPLTGYAIPAGILFEDFTGTTFPPPGWLAINNDAGTKTWVRNTGKSNSPPASASSNWESSSIRNNDWLITPKLSVVSGDSLTFWHSSNGFVESLVIKVGLTNDPNGTWTDLDSLIDDTSPWKYESYDLTAYAGQDVYVAFVNRGLDQFTLYIDDVLGPLIFVPAIDIGLTDYSQPTTEGAFITGLDREYLKKDPAAKMQKISISLNKVGTDNSPDAPIDFEVIVQNFGGTVQNSYQVGWEIDGNLQTSVNNTEPLDVGDVDTLTLTWPVPVAGVHTSRAWTILAGDTNPANDTSGTISFYAVPDNSVFLEGFEDATFPPAGWLDIDADGSGISWFQGNPSVFPALTGNGYAAANFQGSNTSGLIDQWLITPNTGGSSTDTDSLVFYIRTPAGSIWPDSVEIRVSTTGTNTGDFTTLLDYIVVPVNDQYNRFAYVLPNATDRYIAFRYLIYNEGPSANYIGLDLVEIQRHTSGSTFALSVAVSNGWNMVSVPGINPAGMGLTDWWSEKDPAAGVFKYAGGYVQVFTTTPTEGYWMKNIGDTVYNFAAIQIVPHNDVPLALGWNLIGLYEVSEPTATLQTQPAGIITTPIFGYLGGYVPALTIEPGYGYWAKADQAGSIINLTAPPLSKGSGEVVEWFPEDWGKIILTDAAGINYTLYAVNGKVDLNKYELPPAPPSGMFDIRYGSGRIAEDINSSLQTIEMTGVTYPLTVRVEGMDIRVMDETGKTINVNLKSDEDVVISDATIQKLVVTGELLPTVYALEQNYPNPFNPSTTIEFSLPEDVSNVKLSIYNVLGERVAELVNSSLTAGKYQYQWNAKNVATGMYIYELRTDKFVSVKKMLLLK